MDFNEVLNLKSYKKNNILEYVNNIEMKQSSNIFTNKEVENLIKKYSFVDFLLKDAYKYGFEIEDSSEQNYYQNAATVVTEDINTWIAYDLLRKEKTGDKSKKLSDNNFLKAEVQRYVDEHPREEDFDKVFQELDPAEIRKKIYIVKIAKNKKRYKDKRVEAAKYEYLFNRKHYEYEKFKNEKEKVIKNYKTQSYIFNEEERNLYKKFKVYGSAQRNGKVWELICSKASGLKLSSENMPLIDLQGNFNAQCKYISGKNSTVKYASVETIMKKGATRISLFLLRNNGGYAYISTDKNLKDILFDGYKQELLNRLNGFSIMPVQKNMSKDDIKEINSKKNELNNIREQIKSANIDSLIRFSYKCNVSKDKKYYNLYVIANVNKLLNDNSVSTKYLKEIKNVIDINNIQKDFPNCFII